MKQSELSYPKPREESFHRTNRKSSGSVNGETEQRIVKLYTSGQTIESITREVGRARHVVVHILQSKGVFGNHPTEQHEKSRPGAPIEKSKGHLVREVLKTENIAKPTETLSKPKSPRKPAASAKPQPKPAVTPKKPVTDRLSPPVLDALCLVAGQHNLSDMSLEEVQKLALRSKRRVRE